MPLEKDIESWARKYAEKQGLLEFKFVSPNNVGVPDRLFMNNHGLVGFLEFKKPGNKPTKLQQFFLDAFQGRKVIADWVDNKEAARVWIDSFKNQKHVLSATGTSETSN